MHILVILFVCYLVFSAIWLMKQPEKLQQARAGVASFLSFQSKDLATPLKAWIETDLNNDAQLKAWLLSLSNEALQALAEKLTDFCTEMDIDLSWLAEPEVEVEAELQQAAEAILIDYCKLCLKAVQNQPEDKVKQ